MTPAEFAVKKPVATSMFILIVMVLGLVMASQLKIDLYPDITFPLISIVTPYPGAGPEEVENYVTRRIEESVSTVKNLKHIRSVSSEGASAVTVEFEWGINMDYAAQEVRDKIDPVIEYLPKDCKRPYLIKFDPSTLMPFMAIAMTGPQSPADLRHLADKVVQKQLEKVNGVGAVSVTGGDVRQIQVQADQQKLQELGIPITRINEALVAENINLTGGRLDEGKTEYYLRTPAEFKNVSEIGDITIADRGGRPVLLKEIATVKDTNQERRSLARLDGKDCVALEITRQSVANTVETAEKIRKEIGNIEKMLPEGAKLTIAWDQSHFIKNAVNNTREVAVEGGLLAILIIFLFLASARATFIIALSIPSSIFATFIIMKYTGMTLNVLTLAGLTLGIGRIVNDSIVVLESIFRHIKAGDPPIKAAIDGSREVALPVAASTFTTVSVFLPIIFVGGVASQFLGPLAITVVFALLASLVISLTLIPMAASRLLHKDENGDSRFKAFDLPLRKWEAGFAFVERRYERMLNWALNHRKQVFALGLGSLIFGLIIFGFTGKEFSGSSDRSEAYINLLSPPGTSLAATDHLMQQVSRMVNTLVPERTMALEMAMGSEATEEEGAGMAALSSKGAREGFVMVDLTPPAKRKRTQQQIQDELRKNLAETLPADVIVKISDSSSSMMGGQAAISLKIGGDDLETLSKLAEKLKEKFKSIPGLTELELSWTPGTPEYQIVIDRQKAGTYGLSASEIASTIRTLVKGEKVSKFREKGEEYDIVLQGELSDRSWIEKVQEAQIISPRGEKVPLSQIANVVKTAGPSQINRKDRERCIYINGNKTSRPLSQIIADMNKIIGETVFPPGYTWEHEGEEQQRSESFASMGLALIAGILLIYFILGAQFESVIHPFTIMLAIPLEVIGAFLALFLSHMLFNIMAFLGLLMLTGIVVSNSILLVSFINMLRDRGLKRREAIMQAGPIRLRPILMTAMATVLALFPMALGLREGSEFFRPLAMAVIGGLLTSTFLSLLVVPVAYSLIDDLGKRLHLSRGDD